MWILIGFLSMIIIGKVLNKAIKFDNHISNKNLKMLITFLLIMIALGAFLHPFSSLSDTSVITWMTREGIEADTLQNEDYNPLDSIKTFITLLLGRYGPILGLALLGLFFLKLFKEHTTGSWKPWFLINATLIILPFLVIAPYPMEFLAIIIVILAGFGVKAILKGFKFLNRPNFGQILIVFIIVATLIFSSYTIIFRIQNKYDYTGDSNFIDDDLMELAVYVKTNIGNESFLDPDHIQTTRLSALTGKETISYHDYQYRVWGDMEFKTFEVRGMKSSWNSIDDLTNTFYRPHEFESYISLPPGDFYIDSDPEGSGRHMLIDPNLEKYYRIYSNDRVTIWLINEKNNISLLIR
jgi:hypothetical protein